MNCRSPRIVVTRSIPSDVLIDLDRVGQVWQPPFDRSLTVHELKAAVPGAAAILCTLNDRVGPEVLDAAGDQLVVVANIAVGYDNLDMKALAARHVTATNTPGVLVDATADLTWALLLAVTRRLAEGDRLIRTGAPWAWDLAFMLGTGLQGRQLGIIGFGAIGRAVAHRARAFGMDVVVHAPRPLQTPAGIRQVSANELLAESHVVSLHCPLTKSTHHLMGEEALRRMRSDAFLINTSRGPVVDEVALLAALRTGVIAGAALDVYEHEPHVTAGLCDLENVVLLPHLGSATVDTRSRMARMAADNVLAVLNGKEANNRIDFRSCE